MNFSKVLQSESVSLEAKGLYALIRSLSDKEGIVITLVDELMGYTGRSRSSVNRLLKELVDQGIIIRTYDRTRHRTITIDLTHPNNPYKV